MDDAGDDEDEAKRIEEVGAVKQVDPATGEIVIVTFDVVAAMEAVEACATVEDLSATWKAEGAKAVAAKAKAGHAALKDAVREKKNALEFVQDVPAREAA